MYETKPNLHFRQQMAISAKFQQRKQPQRQQSTGEIHQGEAAGECHTLLCFLCFPRDGSQTDQECNLLTPKRLQHLSGHLMSARQDQTKLGKANSPAVKATEINTES